ncbi:MAG TPA: Type 1 glutamine amidotransferase-like domain-containing protein [Gemmatimonadaceae bacterium]|nr:Type 1 glutamine amidotransferase-like domain-containing protein [Gemmatimonadaceae bacterium]
MTTQLRIRFVAPVLVAGAAFVACTSTQPSTSTSVAPSSSGAVTVGPPRGSVVVVGGGAQGPEVFAKFIELAGGPDALIIDVPTAGGDTAYDQTRGGGLRAAGAKNVYVLHTKSRAVADADSFVAPLLKAGGVWFEGGRHFHLVDSYLGTKTEKAFHDVLARGGVVGGSSAGASILGSFLVRGAPSNNNRIMAHPDYLKGFAFLRGVAVDQHVVARERLADLADSITPRWPQLLSISEDEGTAWVVRGDVGEIIGRNKAFAYNGKETDPGKPYLTLHPGARYNLATRRAVHRAIDETPLTARFVDDVFANFGKSGAPTASVVVAKGGKVLFNRAYGIPVQRNLTPETAIPNFPLGAMSDAYNGIVSRGSGRGGGRGAAPGGGQRTRVDTTTRAVESNVDDLHRFELALKVNRAFSRDSAPAFYAPGTAFGWTVDRYNGMVRQAAYGTRDGKRNAYVRFPEQQAAIIILTSSDAADARVMAETIANKLFGGTR